MFSYDQKFLDFSLLEPFNKLDQRGKIMAEYVWIGAVDPMGDVRSKTRTLDFIPTSPDQLPEWNYDGSSTNQASGHDSEVIIKPKAIFKDPFRGGDNILVLCDTYRPNGEPLETNTRAPALEIFNKNLASRPWFGFEQEYTLYSCDMHPLGWPKGGYPGPQGPYYCGSGAEKAFGRAIVEAHYKCCLYAGVNISGINAEVMPGQWEFQVGPCEGIQAGDHLWMARYILTRLTEYFRVVVSFHPKPMQNWNGAGLHTNYSTEEMRNEGGYQTILEAIKKLEAKHKEHVDNYGTDNHLRLTGKFETSSMDRFSYGVADRGASVRIPRSTEKEKKGYFEDRRPASNADPYVVSSLIFKTTVLE
ncbi:hypothetical protein FDP41_009528 [Naegleria fowleri]|uniref:Glutamine synthetase n=1 Tax=Naegleria fowleri TaxID=5763 RepID=A0A6A5BDT1_NAEFO|nr:uncharacterized protein FDP41_009528 [Naegleria fowleri]KAF0972220.1 hypothetical protein FDP41_009528 [Naegleria fowleri]CAG4709332.1 unnamed protein product [Naegleria fowleri]